MASMNWQLMEISRKIKSDPQASVLLDEFLGACFDSVTPPVWAPVAASMRHESDPAERISATLAMLNAYLTHQSILPEGICPPADVDINEWAHDITMQILTNSAC